MTGFRWSFKTFGDGSPFECGACSDTDRAARNCFNRQGLSGQARAVTEYTEEIKEELRRKNTQKVISLGGLRLYECPLSFISEETRDIMRLCFLMDGGEALYLGGGWGDQPCWLVEAFEIYRAESVNASRLKDPTV